MRYEDARRLRDQIRAIEATLESQASVLRDALDRDVVAVAQLAEEGLGVGLCSCAGQAS
jgi:excinuclease ABC subunit C